MRIQTIYLLNNITMLLFLNNVLFASNSFNFSGTSQIETFDLKAENGVKYEHITLEGFFNEGEPGMPSLPVKYINIIIPADQTAVNIRLLSSSKKEYILEEPLYPAQLSYPTTIEEINITFASPNSEIYQSTRPYPDKSVKIIDHNWFDGDKHILTIAIYPVQYFPAENKIILHTNIQYKIDYSSGARGVITHKNRSAKHSSFYSSILKNMVINPDEIPKDDISNKMSKISSEPVAFYEYVVITTNALKNSFNKMIDWKKRKGLEAGIVTVEEILTHYDTDFISGIKDDAGAIRQYLHDAYTAGITIFALMGGDYNHVPIRYGCGSKDTWYAYSTYGANQIPADLYFSDFNGDWDVDGDIYTGEIPYSDGDSPDYGPEIFVGRLLCSSASDVAKWTEKLILYEQNPGRGDYSYLTKAFWASSDLMQKQPNYAKIHLPNSYLHTIYKELPLYYDPNPTFPTGAQVISEINNLYGLLNFFGHGCPIQIITMTGGVNGTPRYSVNTVENIESSSQESESGNSFEDLTNYNHPSIAYSIGCCNISFDDFLSSYYQGRNLGEGFTVMFNTGGPAFLGNTRFGWADYSYLLFEEFADLLTIGGSNLHLGVALAVSKQNNRSMKHYLSYSHNLIGCPETMMWTETPTILTSVSINDNESSLTVDAGTGNCKISVVSVDDGISYHQCAEDVSSFTFTTSVRPLYVTITKPNHLPFTGLTGGSLTSSIELYGKLTILANLIVTNNVTLSINPGAELLLEPNTGITIESGSKIIAVGESDKQIDFKKSSSGNWNRICIKGDNNIFDWCNFDGGKYSIKLYKSSSNKISNCTFNNSQYYGLYSNQSTLTVDNCTFQNASSRAIYCYKGSSSITNNTIFNCTQGIRLYYTSGSKIKSNEIYNITPNGGISISHDSPDIIDNYIHDTNRYGISLNASNSRLEHNSIINCNIGIYSSNNSNYLMDDDAYNKIFMNSSSSASAIKIAGGTPILGESPHDKGTNDIRRGMGYSVESLFSGEILAENIYWGYPLPSSSWFYGNVSWNPWQTTAPADIGSSLGKIVEIPEDRIMLEEGLAFLHKKEHKNAAILFKDLIIKFPDSRFAGMALAWAMGAYNDMGELESQRNYLQVMQYHDNEKISNKALLWNESLESFSGNKSAAKKIVNSVDINDPIGIEIRLNWADNLINLFDDAKSADLIFDSIIRSGVSNSILMVINDIKEDSPTPIYADKEVNQTVPGKYNLSNAYPNPFNPKTTIEYTLPRLSSVNVNIYNILGQKVNNYRIASQTAGVHHLTWNGQNNTGSKAPSGLYIIDFRAESLKDKSEIFQKSIKVIMLK